MKRESKKVYYLLGKRKWSKKKYAYFCKEKHGKNNPETNETVYLQEVSDSVVAEME